MTLTGQSRMRGLAALLCGTIACQAAGAEPTLERIIELESGFGRYYSTTETGTVISGTLFRDVGRPSLVEHGFVFSCENGLRVLGSPGQQEFFIPKYMDALGETFVGLVQSFSGAAVDDALWMYTIDGGLVQLPAPQGLAGAFVDAAASDDLQTFAGFAELLAGPRATIYHADGSTNDLGVLPGATVSRALDISDDGQVVVGDSDGRFFRWTADDGMQELAGLRGPQATVGRIYVSGDGATIIAGQFPAPEHEYYRVQQPDGSIGVLPPLVDSQTLGWGVVRAMSDNGDVVGGLVAESVTMTESYIGLGNPRDAIWTAAFGTMELFDALQSLGFAIPEEINASELRLVAISGDGGSILLRTPDALWIARGFPVNGPMTNPCPPADPNPCSNDDLAEPYAVMDYLDMLAFLEAPYDITRTPAGIEQTDVLFFDISIQRGCP